MRHESLPNKAPIMPVGEFSTDKQTWAKIATTCELILGSFKGKQISQRTWEPDSQPDALRKFGISYGLTLVLARVGQTEPTPDTMYELTFHGRNYSGMFLFEPYLDEPVATLSGDQPKLVPEAELPDARLTLLIDYLNTYLGETNG